MDPNSEPGYVLTPGNFIPGVSDQGYLFPTGVTPDESNPSHYVIGMGDYYTTVTTYSATLFFFILIGVLMVIIGIMYWYAVNRQIQAVTLNITVPEKIVGRIPTPNLHTEHGASTNGVYVSGYDGYALPNAGLCKGQNAGWVPLNSACGCKAPFWGGQCERVAYDSKYISAGSVNTDDVSYVPANIQPRAVDYLSFPTVDHPQNWTSCTNLCNNDNSCHGVIWDDTDRICTPFRTLNVPKVGDMSFDPNVDGNLYVKKSSIPSDPVRIENRVFVFQGTIPLRPWYNVQSVDVDKVQGNNFLAMKADVLYEPGFTPGHVINTTGMIGVYSLKPFTIQDWKRLVDQGNTNSTYVNIPGSGFSYPIGWTGKPVWVMYRMY